MTRSLWVSLLIASVVVVLGTTSSQACHQRSCQPVQSYCQSGYSYGSSTGYYSSGQGGYTTTDGGYYGGGYTGGTAGYPGGYGQPGTGYDFGRPGYNPGGLGGPASGIGVRPGLGTAASARALIGRRSSDHPAGAPPAWTYGHTQGSGGQLMGAAAGYRAAGGKRGDLHSIRISRASFH